METVRRFFKPPMKSFFLFGARGTGKSTWARQYYKHAKIIDLLEPDQFRNYVSFPEHLHELVLANPTTSIFIIDEVQKVPEILSVVHSLIEKNRRLQFILTGSSARKLKRQGVDLLAGRAQLKHMYPFMASELKNLFNLEKSLKHGMLPLVTASIDPIGDLKTYISLYMKEEVQMEGLVRDVGQFGRCLTAMSFSQASIINYTNIARECRISSKTVENYVSILTDLLLCFTINVFSKKAKRHLTTHPKFYYFDAGVYVAIRPSGPLDKPEEISGLAIETLVAQHLLAWINYSEKDGELFFWRTKSGLEVDFIIYGEIGFYALEVKNSKSISPQDLRGLKEFKKDYPESQCIFLYRGKEKLVKNGVLCHPLDDFLRELVPDNTLPEGGSDNA